MAETMADLFDRARRDPAAVAPFVRALRLTGPLVVGGGVVGASSLSSCDWEAVLEEIESPDHPGWYDDRLATDAQARSRTGHPLASETPVPAAGGV